MEEDDWKKQQKEIKTGREELMKDGVIRTMRRKYKKGVQGKEGHEKKTKRHEQRN